MNKCKNCGNEFVPFQKKRYCQNKCIKQYHKKQAIIRKRQERLNDDKHKQRVLFETSLDGEIWKDITNYDGYMVSNMGRIMSKKKYTTNYKKAYYCLGWIYGSWFI